MASALLRRVLIPRHIKRLVTAEEVRQAKGKRKCLRKMLQPLKTRPPEIKLYLALLVKTLDEMIQMNNKPYDKKQRANIDSGYQCQKVLEEIVVRVIKRGERVQNVLEKLKETHANAVKLVLHLIGTATVYS